jgi:hypothetical protein
MLTLLLLKQGERRGVLDGLAEGHHMTLLLINGELEIGDGTDGGHDWNACVMVLRFYFFSLPISVAGFFFNFFKC